MNQRIFPRRAELTTRRQAELAVATTPEHDEHPQSIIDRLQHMIDVAGKTGAAIDTRLLQDLIHDDNVDGGSLFETRRGG